MRQQRVLIFAGIILLGIAIGWGIWWIINQMPDREEEIALNERLHIQQLMPGVFTLANGATLDLRDVNMNYAYGWFSDNFTIFNVRFGTAAQYQMVVSNFSQGRRGMRATMHTIVQGNLIAFDVQSGGSYVTFDALITYFVDVSYRDEATSTIRRVRRETDVMTLRRGVA